VIETKFAERWLNTLGPPDLFGWQVVLIRIQDVGPQSTQAQWLSERALVFNKLEAGGYLEHQAFHHFDGPHGVATGHVQPETVRLLGGYTWKDLPRLLELSETTGHLAQEPEPRDDLDRLGDQYALTRLQGESDYAFRMRIVDFMKGRASPL
jgi:hypothetical protein